MRYSKNENTYVLAEFVSGDFVTIDIYRLNDDVKVVDGANMSEISSTGIFKYLFNIEVTEKTEFLLMVNNGATSKNGQLVIGGYPDTIETLLGSIQTDLSFVKEIEGGRWKIDKTTNQMVFYKEDNTTVVATFALYDDEGASASSSVFERKRV
jgi:hypothetical protein